MSNTAQTPIERTAAVLDAKDRQIAELTAQVAVLRGALGQLHEVCYHADLLEELPERIDGSLLDKARAALATPNPEADAMARESAAYRELVELVELYTEIRIKEWYMTGQRQVFEITDRGGNQLSKCKRSVFDAIEAAMRESEAKQ